jgi:hypothetical protein
MNKKVLIWLSVILVVIFGGRALVQYMSRSANENAATQRVKGFLGGMKTGGDFQEAFNMWETGAVGAIQRMTQDEYNAEVARLNEWMAERELDDRIGSYEILGATVVAPAQGVWGATVTVTCTIDGKRLTIKAVKDKRLEWTD